MTSPPAAAASLLPLTCVLTFLHFTGVQMRVPVLPLYAAAHGATPTAVGVIVGIHMVVAALGSIPLGHASDRWGRRRLLVGGVALGALSSLALPLVQGEAALTLVYGLAGIGLAAFNPTVLSLVGDVARPGTAARAYAWYSTALYTAFGVGPVLGGWVAERWGHASAFVGAGAIMAAGLAVATRLPTSHASVRSARLRVTGQVMGNRCVWAAWIAAVGGLTSWGAVLTFFPLLGASRGLGASEIGLVFGVQALASTLARLPAGWAIDRTRGRRPWMVVALLAAAAGTAALAHVGERARLIALAAGLGVAHAAGFVTIGAVLAETTTPATRGLAMGGYSTAIYAGIALGSLPLGPVVTRWGYAAGFTAAAGVAAGAALAVSILLRAPGRGSPRGGSPLT